MPAQPDDRPGVLYNEPRGNLLPFGGTQAYKGFGLGLLLDMLCGGLSGGACSNPAFPLPGVGNAAVFILLNPALFGGTDHFLKEADALDGVRALLPNRIGDCGDHTTRRPRTPRPATRRALEGIPIPDGTWELITKAARTLGVSVPSQESLPVAPRTSRMKSGFTSLSQMGDEPWRGGFESGRSSAFVSMGLLASLLPGCNARDDVWPKDHAGPKVVVSFAPLYCFAVNVAGDDAVVRNMMTTSGPHHFNPTDKDARLLRRADLFFVNGIGLEGDKPDDAGEE